MDLTILSKNLLTDKQQDQSEAGLLNSYQGFLGFIKKLSGICVYFYSGDSYAYIANTAFLLQRLLLEEAGFQGEICLAYNKNDEVLCSKIRQNLPFFEDNRYSYAANARQIKHPLVLSGGGNQTDIFWQQLGQEVRYIITIRPYLDNDDFSFMKIRNQQGDWITYYTDTLLLNQYLADCNFFLNLKSLGTLTDEKKAYWKKLYGHLDLADAILQSSGETIFTIDGVSGHTALANRGEKIILILSLAMLIQFQQTGKPCILAVIGTDSAKDRMFSLLQRFCDTAKDADAFFEALADLYPSAREEDLRIGLLNPLLKKRTQLRPVLDKIGFADKPAGFDKNNFCICAVGELPYDYTEALFAKSSYVFFESCDYTNLAVNLGIPYLQKSIEASAAVYPDRNAPQTARQLTKLCEIFSNDISAYTNASDKSLNEQIDAAAAFLKEPPADYFLSLSNYAQGKKDKTSEPSLIYDKLAGIGKNISYGILSGGFSLTASVILEGVIAKWLPHIPETSAPAAEPWYYYLEGVISLTGNIYGCIDFAIISASVNLTVNVTASFIYETCRAVLLTISAYVEASASLRTNLGLFKISIGFHFKVQV